MKEIKRPVYDVVAHANHFRVLRNERPLMTPEGKPYDLPHKDMAEAVADEWRAQVKKINTANMPLTQLLATALDIVPKERAKIIEGLLAFTRSELLCHRAERPQSLADKQQKNWQPVLDWCAARFKIDFCLTSGVMPVAQKQEMVEVLRGVFEAYDDLWLTGVRQAADTAGSLVLGLALAEQHLTAQEVFKACELDVLHQSLTWGDDPVTQGRQKAVRFDLDAVERWFSLLRG